MSKDDRIVTVHVKQTSRKVDEEDESVAGKYDVRINEGVPEEEFADVALDELDFNGDYIFLIGKS